MPRRGSTRRRASPRRSASTVEDRLHFRVRQPRPATLFGAGQVERIADAVRQAEAELLIVDAAITPVQQKNLEDETKAKVIDRTGLILEIFGERAATAEGRLQVELAHLDYQAGRLVRSWTHLERQRGGFGFLGGPGETQIEADRRLIRDRMAKLQQGARPGRAHPHAAPRAPPARALAGDRPGRLHQCRQVDPVQPADPRRRAGRGPAVRDARPDDARDRAARASTRRSCRTRSASSPICRPSSSPPSGRRSRRWSRPISSSTSATSPIPTARRSAPTSSEVLAEIGRARRRALIEAWNKIDLLGAEEAARVRAEAARREDVVVLSALSGEGVDAPARLRRRPLAQGRERCGRSRCRRRTARRSPGCTPMARWSSQRDRGHGDDASRCACPTATGRASSAARRPPRASLLARCQSASSSSIFISFNGLSASSSTLRKRASKRAVASRSAVSGFTPRWRA